MDIIKAIQSKYSTLRDSGKAKVSTYVQLLAGDRLGELGYVPIDGVDLGGLEKRMVKSGDSGGAEEYLDLVIDAIQIVDGAGHSRETYMCSPDGVNLGHLMGVNAVQKGREDVLQDWYDKGDTEEKVGGYKGERVGDIDYVTDEIGKDKEEGVSKADTSADKDTKEGRKKDDAEDAEDTDKKSSKKDNYAGLREEVRRVFNSTIIQNIDAVLRRYSMLYESGYDLERPYGFISSQGIVYVDSENVLKIRDDYRSDIDLNASVKLYDYFESKVDFIESDTRSMKGIAEDMLEGYKEGKILYFPYKMIEYAYGRDSSSSESKEYRYAKYKGEGISTKWGKMREKIREDVKLLIENCVVIYCVNVLGCSKDGGIEERKKILSQNDAINGYIKYITSSLSTSVIMTDYKSVESKPVKMRLRVCDPNGHCYEGMIEDVLKEAFAGNTGGSEGVSLNSSLNAEDSRTYLVYEYCHEFNHKLSNAMPLFAYKALEKIQEKGDTVSFKNLILGQSSDGTILRNGTNGVSISKNLFHYIIAGSRSGKGVMTLNLLAAAIASGKAIFYLDNKPDMVSILCRLAGGNSQSGPIMYALNGSDYIADHDSEGQFVFQNTWVNSDNIPPELIDLLDQKVEYTNTGYATLFYLRAAVLAFGILMSRATIGGKGLDPAYNGKDGMFIVCDEVTNLSRQMVELLISKVSKLPALSRVYEDKVMKMKSAYEELEYVRENKPNNIRKAVDSLTSVVSSFTKGFSASSFYGLSLFLWLKDNRAFLDERGNAGMDMAEFGRSDVVVIGQDLECRNLSVSDYDSIVQSRFATDSKGINKSTYNEYITADCSYPISQVTFGSADGFFGFNGKYPKYFGLDEANKFKSKAFGKLDDTARNFCYTPKVNMRDGILGSHLTLSKANDPSTVYFKPYLILNDNKGIYLDGLLEQLKKNGVTIDDLIREYPDSSGENLNPAIGLPSYLEKMGVSDIESALRKGADVANYVVANDLGYQDDGSGRPLWLQFVTDLRPEWMLSIRDITGLILKSNTNVEKGKKNPILKEYYEYIDFYESFGKMVGIVDSSASASPQSGNNGENNSTVDGLDWGSDGYNDSYVDDDYDNNASDKELSEVFDKAEEDEKFAELFEDWDSVEEGEEYEDGGDYDGFEGEDIPLDPNAVFAGGSNVYGSYTEGEGMGDGVEDNEDIPVEDYYGVSEGMDGVDCGYKPAEDSDRDTYDGTDMREVGRGLNGRDAEVRAQSLAQLIGIVTGKVLKAYGGYDRIKSIRVLGGGLVVNGVMYRCKISDNTIGILPLDIRRKIRAGNVADLFNYHEMLNMRNLRGIEFDSRDFLSSVVCEEMGYHGTLGIDYFFRDIPSLQMLVVGKNKFTRQNYKEEIKKDEDFYYTSQGTAYASACDKVLGRWAKNSWSFTRNMLTDRNRGIFTRVLGVVFGGAATVVVGVADAGAKGVKGVSSVIDRRRKGGRVRRGLKGFKSSFDDLF